MNVENITSNAMSLDRNGQSMLIQVYEKEIERLNNIINELEKWINKNLNDINVYFENTPFGVEDTYKEVLDKLKELKENK